MRAEIEKLDASIVAARRRRARTIPSALRDTEHERAFATSAIVCAPTCARLRDRAATRLAATVAALESIRLDLLRLQLGDGRVESVTASLDAARDVATDLGAYVDATEEVERIAAAAPPLTPRTSFP